jgi:serine/threonine protein kinase
MASLMAPFPKAKVNGQYVLKEKIGQGSFGQVFKGKKNKGT